MVKYPPPILTNFSILLYMYQNQIFRKHYTEDMYHINLDISIHCPIDVYLRRHKNGLVGVGVREEGGMGQNFSCE